MPCCDREQQMYLPAVMPWMHKFCQALYDSHRSCPFLFGGRLSKATLYFCDVLHRQSERLKENLSSRFGSLKYNYIGLYANHCRTELIVLIGHGPALRNLCAKVKLLTYV